MRTLVVTLGVPLIVILRSALPPVILRSAPFIVILRSARRRI